MRRFAGVVLAVGALAPAPTRLPLPKVDDVLARELRGYLSAHYATPEDYIVGKFRDHDIVFVGEMHRIKRDVELIQSLIPLLYRNGVFTLCTEFARREDQALVDRLLSSPTYDEALAREITFRCFFFWGYQEYVDIYKAAWRLNRSLPSGARRFRILALNDSPDWSLIKRPEDRHSREIMDKVRRGGGEQVWAELILNEVVAKREKALVYSGIHHAFTEYQQPIVNGETHRFVRFETERMGNFVFRKIGKRAITIALHAPWRSAEGYESAMVYPVDGVIDAVMSTVDPAHRRVGFDTHGTPFGRLPATTAVYRHGYAHFTLEDFCDGYVYQEPFSEYEGVTPIKDFVNAGNLKWARQHSSNPELRTWTIDEFNREAAQNADIPLLLAHLQ
jgi:hypothetical protein